MSSRIESGSLAARQKTKDCHLQMISLIDGPCSELDHIVTQPLRGAGTILIGTAGFSLPPSFFPPSLCHFHCLISLSVPFFPRPLEVSILFSLSFIHISFFVRLRNDLYCVGWGVKLYSLTHISFSFSFLSPPLTLSLLYPLPSPLFP